MEQQYNPMYAQQNAYPNGYAQANPYGMPEQAYPGAPYNTGQANAPYAPGYDQMQQAPVQNNGYDYMQQAQNAGMDYNQAYGNAEYANPMYANPAYKPMAIHNANQGNRFAGIKDGVKSLPNKMSEGLKSFFAKFKKESPAPNANTYMQEAYMQTQIPMQAPFTPAPQYAYADNSNMPAVDNTQEIFPTTEIIITQSAKDCPDMIRRLNNPFISIVNMEELPEDEYRIAYNILLGAKLALRYNLFKCGRGIFLLAPGKVTIGMNEVTRGIVEKLSRENAPYAQQARYYEPNTNAYPRSGNFGAYR